MLVIPLVTAVTGICLVKIMRLLPPAVALLIPSCMHVDTI